MRGLVAAATLLLLGVVASWFWLRLEPAAPTASDAVEPAELPVDETPRPAVTAGPNPRAAVATESTDEVAERTTKAPETVRGAPENVRVLHGVLLDAETGEALGGHALRLWRQFGREDFGTVTTAADGRFDAGPLPLTEVVFVHVPDAADRERALQREIEPMSVELTADASGEPLEVVLRARRPPGVVDVVVLAEDGSPAPGVTVAQSEISARRRYESTTTTDGNGEAVLGLWDPENLESAQIRAFRALEGIAASDGGQSRALQPAVSDLLAIPAPFNEYPRQLQLGRPAGLAVLVRTSAGDPVSNARLRVQADTPHGPSYGYEQTDGEGRYQARRFHPGVTYVAVDNPSLGYAQSERVELVRGTVTPLEIVLRDGPLRAGARGRAVDRKDGAGIAGVQIAYRAGDGERLTTTTGAEGSFVCWSLPAEVIWLSANLDPDGDAWSPASLELPFGTEDVVFERLGDVPTTTFALEVVSAVTGEPFEHYYAAIDLGPGTEEWGYSLARRAEFELRVREGTRWRVAAEHHLVATLDLQTELQALPEGEPLVVRLSPGFDAHLVALDSETEEPLPGVAFRSPDAPIARTDASGRAHLQAEHWATYRITAPGYEDDTFDPVDFFLFDWPPVYLQPTGSGEDDE